MQPTQYAYHFGGSFDWGAENTATQEGIHSFSIDRVSIEISLLKADYKTEGQHTNTVKKDQKITIIASYYSKFIPYELVGEPNGPINHGLQRSEINKTNSFILY